MPLPKIEFNKEMTNLERLRSLKQMQEYIASPAASREKQIILETVIQFSYKHLINLKSHVSKPEPEKFPLCCKIFSCADLSDLLFAKLVFNELDKIEDKNHVLRKTTLPLAKKLKDFLLAPQSSKIKNAAVIFIVIALSLKRLELAVGFCFVYAYSDYLAELSLENALDNFLGERFSQDAVESVNDETSILYRFSRASKRYALQLFQREVLGDLASQNLQPSSDKRIVSFKGK